MDTSFPLIDLHRHLEGCIRPSTFLELGLQHNVSMPAQDIEGLRPYLQVGGPSNLIDFLNRLKWMSIIMVDYDACRRIAYENVADARKQGIDYTELRFSPWFMAKDYRLKMSAVIEAVADGIAAGCRDFGLQVRLIGILPRTFGPAAASEVLDNLLERRDAVAAVDLAGYAEKWPQATFAELFHKARQADFHITIHHNAEFERARDIWEAVNLLGAERIGHGARAIDDPALLDYLVEHRIGIECCLTSNVQTRAVPDYASHPLAAFLERGVLASINTDDPTTSGIDLQYEYGVAAPAAGLSQEQIVQAQHNALETAFLSASEKTALVDMAIHR